MTIHEARRIVGMLLKFYPNHRLDDDAAELFAQAWMELRKESALSAVQTWVKTSKFFPQVSELLETARAARPEREIYQQRQLPPHCVPPEEIREIVMGLVEKMSAPKPDATQSAWDKCSCLTADPCSVPGHGSDKI